MISTPTVNIWALFSSGRLIYLLISNFGWRLWFCFKQACEPWSRRLCILSNLCFMCYTAFATNVTSIWLHGATRKYVCHLILWYIIIWIYFCVQCNICIWYNLNLILLVIVCFIIIIFIIFCWFLIFELYFLWCLFFHSHLWSWYWG